MIIIIIDNDIAEICSSCRHLIEHYSAGFIIQPLISFSEVTSRLVTARSLLKLLLRREIAITAVKAGRRNLLSVWLLLLLLVRLLLELLLLVRLLLVLWLLLVLLLLRVLRLLLVLLLLLILVVVVVIVVLISVLVGRSFGELLHGEGARDVLSRISNVQRSINSRGNGLDFSAQLLLNLVKVESVVPADQVDGKTQMAKSA